MKDHLVDDPVPLASSAAVMKSRSVSFEIFSTVWPLRPYSEPRSVRPPRSDGFTRAENGSKTPAASGRGPSPRCAWPPGHRKPPGRWPLPSTPGKWVGPEGPSAGGLFRPADRCTPGIRKHQYAVLRNKGSSPLVLVCIGRFPARSTFAMALRRSPDPCVPRATQRASA